MQALSTGRVLGAVVGIYAAQSIVGGLVFQSVPAVLRQQGQQMGVIGLVWLLMLAHALKFLWSPQIERLRLRPDGTRRSRHIILVGQGLVVLVLATLASTGTDPAMLLVLLACATLVTATVDIACDAFAIEQLPGRARGWGNVMQVGGAYLGVMLGGGAFLILVGRTGWSVAMLTLAALLALLTLPLFLTREPMGDAARQAAHRPSLLHALRRPAFRAGLGAVVLAQVGLRLGHAMLAPFLVDRGFDLETLGWLTGIGGTLAGLAGTVVAASFIARRSAARLLAAAVAGQGLMFLMLGAVALAPGLPREAAGAMAVLLGFVIGASFVLLYTAMMGWAAGPQPGVDFTLLQSADATIAALAGVAAGALAQAFGPAACFLLAALLALTLSRLLPRLTQRAEIMS